MQRGLAQAGIESNPRPLGTEAAFKPLNQHTTDMSKNNRTGAITAVAPPKTKIASNGVLFQDSKSENLRAG